MPFSKTPSTTSLPLRYLAVQASQLDLNPIPNIIGLDSFNLEYTGLDSDLAWACLFCSHLIVYYVDLTLLDYLSQCSGTLQELSLFLQGDSGALAGRFWATVRQNTLLNSRFSMFVLALEVDGVSVIRPFT